MAHELGLSQTAEDLTTTWLNSVAVDQRATLYLKEQLQQAGLQPLPAGSMLYTLCHYFELLRTAPDDAVLPQREFVIKHSVTHHQGSRVHIHGKTGLKETELGWFDAKTPLGKSELDDIFAFIEYIEPTQDSARATDAQGFNLVKSQKVTTDKVAEWMEIARTSFPGANSKVLPNAYASCPNTSCQLQNVTHVGHNKWSSAKLANLRPMIPK